MRFVDGEQRNIHALKKPQESIGQQALRCQVEQVAFACGRERLDTGRFPVIEA